MLSLAHLIIRAAAANKNDIARLKTAYDFVWAKIAERIGDHEAAREEVAERLARLIVATGDHRPEIDAVALAKIVGRTFDANVDQEPL